MSKPKTHLQSIAIHLITSLFAISALACQITSLHPNIDKQPWIIVRNPFDYQETVINLPLYTWTTISNQSNCDYSMIHFSCLNCDTDFLILDLEQNTLRVSQNAPVDRNYYGSLKAKWQDGEINAPDLNFMIVHKFQEKFEPVQVIQETQNNNRALATTCYFDTYSSQSPSSYTFNTNSGTQTIQLNTPTYDSANCCMRIDPQFDDYVTYTYYEINICTWNSDTIQFDCTYEMNSISGNWVELSGTTLTIDTTKTSYFTTQVRYYVDVDFYLYQITDATTITDLNYDDYLYYDDDWYIYFSIKLLCQYTSITTDNAMTGQTLYYMINSDSICQYYDYDTIISTTPDCGYDYFDYYMSTRGSSSSLDYSDYGMYSYSSYLQICLFSDLAETLPFTLYMQWWAIPYYNPDQPVIAKNYTMIYYNGITSVTSTQFDTSYVFTIGVSGTIGYPTFDVSPYSVQSDILFEPTLFSLNVTSSSTSTTTIIAQAGVSVSTLSWLSYDTTSASDFYYQDAYFTILSNSISDIDIYTFDVEVTWTDNFLFTETFTYQFTVQIQCEATGATYTQLTYMQSSVTVTIYSSTAQSIDLATYSITPTCLSQVTSFKFSQSQFGPFTILTAPAWFSSDYSTYLEILSSDITLASSTYYIQQTTTFGSTTTLTSTDLIAVTFSDPCTTTTFVDQTISPNVISQLIGATATITLPTLSDSANLLYGTDSTTSICGLQQVTVTENSLSTSSYIQQSTVNSEIVLTISTSDSMLVGSHSVLVTWKLTSYITVTSSQYLTIYFCTLLAPTISTPSPYTIWSASQTFSISPFTISPASQSSVFTIEYSLTKSDGTAYPSFISFTQDLAFTISSQLYSDAGTYSFKLIATAVSTTDGSQLTSSALFSLTMVDPCTQTQFVSQTVESMSQFINLGNSVSVLQVSLPVLTDTVNALYGSDPLNSICYTQTITITDETGSTPTYISLVTFDNSASQTMQIQTQDTQYAGVHNIFLLYQLSRYSSTYPSIQTTLTTTLTFYELVTPDKVENQNYTISQPQLQIVAKMFKISPDSYGSVLLDNQISLSNGNTLPEFITSVCDSSKQLCNLSIQTSDSSKKGSYLIQMTATASLINSQSCTLSYNFKITLSTATTNFTTKPSLQWSSDIVSNVTLTIGQEWTYTLPSLVEIQNDIFTTTVNLGTAFQFVKFSNNVFTIATGKTDLSMISTYPLQITVIDSYNSTLETIISLSIISNITQEDNKTTELNQTSSIQTPKAEELTQDQQINQALSFLQSLQTSSTGWNWADQLKKVKKDQNICSKKPQVFINKLTSTGVLELIFSKEMQFSPVQDIQNAFVTINGVRTQAVIVTVIPSFQSSLSQLNFTYNITSYTSKILKIQLNFEYPLNVSVNIYDPDKLKVLIVGNQYFFDKQGCLLLLDNILERRLPSQLPLGGLVQKLAESGGSVTSVTQAITATNFAVTLLMTASLNYLWGMVDILQLVLYLPVFYLYLPPNASIFFNFLLQIASFSIIPTDYFYQNVLNFNYPDPPDGNYASLGYGTTLFLFNIGSMIISILIYPVLILLTVFMKCLICKPKCLEARRKKLHKCLFWTQPIVTIFQSYSMLSMCCFINIKYFNQSNVINVVDDQYQISNVLTIIFTVIIISTPILVVIVMLKHWKNFQHGYEIENYGVLLETLNIKSGRLIIVEPVTYLLRRMGFALIVIFCDTLVFQIFYVFATVLWQIYFVCHIKPYEDYYDYRMTIINEFFVLLVTYSFMCFSDFVLDVNAKYFVGFICSGFVLLNLLLNIMIMFYFTLRSLRMQLKRWWQRKFNKKRVVNSEQQPVEIKKNKSKKKKEISVVDNSQNQLQSIEEVSAEQLSVSEYEKVVSHKVQTLKSEISDPLQTQRINQNDITKLDHNQTYLCEDNLDQVEDEIERIKSQITKNERLLHDDFLENQTGSKDLVQESKTEQDERPEEPLGLLINRSRQAKIQQESGKSADHEAITKMIDEAFQKSQDNIDVSNNKDQVVKQITKKQKPEWRKEINNLVNELKNKQ